MIGWLLFRRKKRSVWHEWILASMWAILILLIVRNFFLTLCMVRSDSMRGCVQEGDWVFVNELAYGPRLPSTLVCVPFTSVYWKQAETGIVRISGYSEPAYNDLLVFNDPTDEQEAIERRRWMLKRLIALPGDSIRMKDDTVWVNGVIRNEPGSISRECIIEVDDEKAWLGWYKKKNLQDVRVLAPGVWLAELNAEQYHILQSSKWVQQCHPALVTDTVQLNASFFGCLKGFDENNFPSIRIPKKGMKIQLSGYTVQLYGHCIRLEGHTVELNSGQVMIDGKVSQSYVFDQDYYYVMGDARNRSIDSRHWGFLPKDHFVGRASRIFLSFGREKDESWIRWNRVFKTIQ